MEAVNPFKLDVHLYTNNIFKNVMLVREIILVNSEKTYETHMESVITI
jgi:hypothetical protein